ncbi:MAG: RNA polymerase subunit sigma-24, partial [Tidjanibacter sp.]|nr:RNA polymerase subunit sigma-24 [Tidjanibacter sp.]
MIRNSVSGVSSDQELLNAYLAGNNQAISQLIERHRRRVYDYVYIMVKDPEVAEDICQETFVKAVRVIEQG